MLLTYIHPNWQAHKWHSGDTHMSSHLLFSIPFHLTALFPLSVHPSTYRPGQQQLNHHSKPLAHSPLLCLIPRNKRKRPLELHLTRRVYQLCQPTNGRAGWPAVTCIKGGHLTSERHHVVHCLLIWVEWVSIRFECGWVSLVVTGLERGSRHLPA